LGGLLPRAAFAIAATTGDMTSGLWYSIVIALASAAIGLVFVRETRNVDLEMVGR
jgi:hypothetical protein